MPQVVAALGPVLTGLLVSAAVSGLTYGLQVALAPNGRKQTQSGRIDALRSITQDNTAPMRIVYGTYRASGVLAYARSTDAAGSPAVGGRYLHIALALAHGPVDDIYDIQLNDEPADSSKFATLATLIPFMGGEDQAMVRGPIKLSRLDSAGNVAFDTVALPHSWLRLNRPGRQVAGVYGILRHDPEIFPGGAPNIRATMRGRLVYDPREDVSHGGAQRVDDPSTWRFSNNAALPDAQLCSSAAFGVAL